MGSTERRPSTEYSAKSRPHQPHLIPFSTRAVRLSSDSLPSRQALHLASPWLTSRIPACRKSRNRAGALRILGHKPPSGLLLADPEDLLCRLGHVGFLFRVEEGQKWEMVRLPVSRRLIVCRVAPPSLSPPPSFCELPLPRPSSRLLHSRPLAASTHLIRRKRMVASLAKSRRSGAAPPRIFAVPSTCCWAGFAI